MPNVTSRPATREVRCHIRLGREGGREGVRAKRFQQWGRKRKGCLPDNTSPSLPPSLFPSLPPSLPFFLPPPAGRKPACTKTSRLRRKSRGREGRKGGSTG